MQQLLAGPWQISPLTDLSIPQNDLHFPAAISQALPQHLSETEIANQEWHLMHDVLIEEVDLSCAVIELVVAGCEHYAEVRVNGVALFDCDHSAVSYRKNIRPYLALGGNRIEILFLEEDTTPLIDEQDLDDASEITSDLRVHSTLESAMGLHRAPYLQFSRHIQLETITAEQYWHPSGGCEVKVSLGYTAFSSGLVSASVKLDGMTLTLPLDMRSSTTSALFQLEAPVEYKPGCPRKTGLYQVEVQLDGYQVVCDLPIDPQSPAESWAMSDLV